MRLEAHLTPPDRPDDLTLPEDIECPSYVLTEEGHAWAPMCDHECTGPCREPYRMRAAPYSLGWRIALTHERASDRRRAERIRRLCARQHQSRFGQRITVRLESADCTVDELQVYGWRAALRAARALRADLADELAPWSMGDRFARGRRSHWIVVLDARADFDRGNRGHGE